jgi:type IV secretion system protein VirD4
VRLILNQIGRCLTERLEGDPTKSRKHKLLLMLDEFPALGRLDFFETALAFMAGYGIRAYLIAQSLNQISKAYGENNAILDNCHVRIAFSSNDERTAKRISDALGTATELRAQRNYAGHRLSPWLSHVMVSKQETARALLTPGEVMQLPPNDQLVLVSSLPPIRAKKLRYYEDRNFIGRVLGAPRLGSGPYADRPNPRPNDWSGQVRTIHEGLRAEPEVEGGHQEDEGGRGIEPQLAEERALPEREPEQQAESESDEAAPIDALARLRRAAAIAPAHAMNEGEHRHDVLPSF